MFQKCLFLIPTPSSQVYHERLIDTALSFEHPRGPPFKPALRWLVEHNLKREIQTSDEDGHDRYVCCVCVCMCVRVCCVFFVDRSLRISREFLAQLKFSFFFFGPSIEDARAAIELVTKRLEHGG